MSNNTLDYKEDLVFEPDYSIYQTARKLRKLARERNNRFKRFGKFYLDFDNFTILMTTREVFTYNGDILIVCAKSNKHLVDIVEVLTRS